MQSKSRKLLSVLLALVMGLGVIAVAPVTASATTVHEVSTASQLTDAIDNAVTGDTIKLLANINYTDWLEIDSKIITFDLNGKTLNATGGLNVHGAAGVSGPTGELKLAKPINGAFNVSLDSNAGLGQGDVAVWGDTSKIEVTSIKATGTDMFGIIAFKCDVVVYGDVEVACTVSPSTACCGVEAYHNSNVTIEGKRLDEVNRLVERLYEDTVLGRISAENFDRMISKYQGEQKDLTAQIEAVERAEKAQNDTRTDAERCASLLADHAGITELTPEILNALISRIDVHEPHEVDGMMQQDIDIHYRHAGLLEAVEFDSSTFYKSEKVKQASRQRMKPGGKSEAVAMEQDKLSA